jgi:DHA1 family multidrug resistance protein-like MFS transporter
MTIASLPDRLASWFDQWSGIAPLLVAEFILWIGFGALLPVMPLYFTSFGVDIALLGVVVAAWPATRLVAEPVFGWIADRTPRVPLMVAGLLISGAGVGLALLWTGPLPFFLLRAVAGLGTAIYDPAARGFLTDATPGDRRGEAFGLYGAAQMGGLLLGPAFGGIGASLFGGIAFVFGFSAVASALAAIAIGLRVHDRRGAVGHHARATALGEFPAEPAASAAAAAQDLLSDHEHGFGPPPTSLRNRLLVTAIVFNIGGWFAGGMYEVAWSLFLADRGAGVQLIGLTFAVFAIPVLFLSPLAGRLVDRRGPLGFMVAGALAATLMMGLYPFIPDPRWAVPMIAVEGAGFALQNPAIYAVVAAGTPVGRSSTAQGIFGAFGTLATILASISAGYLASVNLSYPFWLGAAISAVVVVVAVLVDGGRTRQRFARSGGGA